jgi:superfamily I DNA/RNA helicase
MNFILADSFTDSLARLTHDEQKLASATVFTLFNNPAHPSLQFHKLEKSRDPDFASLRVNLDLRVIVHRQPASLLLCYVDHHDRAYEWAQRRKLTTHPATGAIQIVEIRETIQEIKIPVYIQEPTRESAKRPTQPRLFPNVPEEQLLSYGVPPEWIADVLAATEDSLLELAGHLPPEAAEALLELATGKQPKPRLPLPKDADPFTHPDAQRRFRNVLSSDELARALEFPWEKWIIFLHPDQRSLVEKDFSGPARVSGSAGTGKTIVALHRATYLATANPDARVLLTTFSDPLAASLHSRLRRLIAKQPQLADRLDVQSLSSVGQRLYQIHFPKPAKPQLLDSQTLHRLLSESAASVPGHKFSDTFLRSEWHQIVDAWSLRTWESYRDVPRLGRRTRLTEPQRQLLWQIFARLRELLTAQNRITESDIFNSLATKIPTLPRSPFEFVVVDECQDLSVAQLRFLAALAGTPPAGTARNRLFFAGDLGQRIFEPPFSWKSLGIDIRGRSTTLRVNYRTSHQIRATADRLLASEITDVDGNTEARKGTVSVFNGPQPEIHVFSDAVEEKAYIAAQLKIKTQAGASPQSIGLFVRSAADLPRAQAVATEAGLEFATLDEHMPFATNRIAIATMHLAKGLEFHHVFVMACDEDVLPSAERVAAAADTVELEEVYQTERHLLYVAATRARDSLVLTAVAPGSEFLQDLQA